MMRNKLLSVSLLFGLIPLSSSVKAECGLFEISEHEHLVFRVYSEPQYADTPVDPTKQTYGTAVLVDFWDGEQPRAIFLTAAHVVRDYAGVEPANSNLRLSSPLISFDGEEFGLTTEVACESFEENEAAQGCEIIDDRRDIAFLSSDIGPEFEDYFNTGLCLPAIQYRPYRNTHIEGFGYRLESTPSGELLSDVAKIDTTGVSKLRRVSLDSFSYERFDYSANRKMSGGPVFVVADNQKRALVGLMQRWEVDEILHTGSGSINPPRERVYFSGFETKNDGVNLGELFLKQVCAFDDSYKLNDFTTVVVQMNESGCLSPKLAEVFFEFRQIEDSPNLTVQQMGALERKLATLSSLDLMVVSHLSDVTRNPKTALFSATFWSTFVRDIQRLLEVFERTPLHEELAELLPRVRLLIRHSIGNNSGNLSSRQRAANAQVKAVGHLFEAQLQLANNDLHGQTESLRRAENSLIKAEDSLRSAVAFAAEDEGLALAQSRIALIVSKTSAELSAMESSPTKTDFFVARAGANLFIAKELFENVPDTIRVEEKPDHYRTTSQVYEVLGDFNRAYKFEKKAGKVDGNPDIERLVALEAMASAEHSSFWDKLNPF